MSASTSGSDTGRTSCLQSSQYRCNAPPTSTYSLRTRRNANAFESLRVWKPISRLHVAVKRDNDLDTAWQIQTLGRHHELKSIIEQHETPTDRCHLKDMADRNRPPKRNIGIGSWKRRHPNHFDLLRIGAAL